MRKNIRRGLAAAVGCLALWGIMGTSGASAAPAAAAPAAAAIRSFEAGAAQQVSADGTFVHVTVANPHVASGDIFTDAQVLVSSADGKQIVVVGWIVDHQLFNDSRTHLFADISVNGQFLPFDSDYQSVPGSCQQPGTVLRPGGQEAIAILQHAGNWWVGFGGRWCGRFSDTLWHGKFTKAGLIEWAGAVAVATSRPCTQMGDGKAAASRSAAGFSRIGLYTSPNGKAASPRFVLFADDSRLYSASKVSRTAFRFGGGGAC
jgi:hypothetical protein